MDAKIVYRKNYDQFYESNGYGKMELIERLPERKFLVKFLNTGYETIALIENIRKGKVRDFSVPRSGTHDWSDWDESFVNNSGCTGKIISKKSKLCIVQFDSTGYTAEALIHNVRKGKIVDPYHKSVLGIGFLGEYDSPSHWKPAKQLWSNMMKRCYNPKDKHGYFGRCFVDVRWHCFADFLRDLRELDNFQLWLDGKNSGVPYNLDKDAKFSGNKIYSREACMFITEYENKSLGAINARLLDKTNGRYS